jgi:hypothetical protein
MLLGLCTGCRRGARSGRAWLSCSVGWSSRTFEALLDRGGQRMAMRRRVDPTDERAELELLLEWPTQVECERIRPALVSSASEGAVTGPAGSRP